jgi:protein-S-isoprenylcysteine O-methyltransferase Ste14
MVDFISSYPFALAFLAAALAEFSAILIRRTAPNIGKWSWGLAGVLSACSVIGLVWSLIWAVSVQVSERPAPPAVFQVLGIVLALLGGTLLFRSLISLGRQTVYAWPGARLITKSPYNHLRRPMATGLGIIALGLALVTINRASWVWLLGWAILSPLLSELEEWELKERIPGAAAYFRQTPRYLPRVLSVLRK